MACPLWLLPMLSAAELRATGGIVPGISTSRSGDAPALCARGDTFFRNAEFARAEQFYLDAEEANPDSARAHLGLGRIARLHFQRKTACDHFATAFRLSPSDPDILLAYSEYVSDPRVRAAVSGSLRRLAEPPDPRVLQVIARLLIENAVASPLRRLAGPYRSYRLKLSPFLPANSTPYGAVLKVSINGGKPLRLVLDTGGTGIVVGAKSVRELGLDFVAASEIGGLGASGSNAAHVALARSMEIGDFRLQNCPVAVSGKSIVSGADGIIGADIFQGFLLRLDLWSQRLDLLPFPDHAPEANGQDPWLDYDASPESRRPPLTPALHIGHLLAVPTTVDRKQPALFVIDTGSAYSSVSRGYLCRARDTAGGMGWRGVQGFVGARLAASPVEFGFSGGTAFTDANVIALDLTEMAEKEGTKIAGLLGYSSLSKLAAVINYRDGVVQFEPHNRR